MMFGLVSRGYDKGYFPQMRDKLSLEKLADELIPCCWCGYYERSPPNLTAPASLPLLPSCERAHHRSPIIAMGAHGWASTGPGANTVRGRSLTEAPPDLRQVPATSSSSVVAIRRSATRSCTVGAASPSPRSVPSPTVDAARSAAPKLHTATPRSSTPPLKLHSSIGLFSFDFLWTVPYIAYILCMRKMILYLVFWLVWICGFVHNLVKISYRWFHVIVAL
jgi:hypothetical protein